MTAEARVEPRPFTLREKKWYYKSEGNANVVLTVPEDGTILRVMKDGGDDDAAETLSLRRDYCDAVRRLFFGHHADVPVVVAVSAEELRDVDACLWQDRPASRAHKRLRWTTGLAAVCPDYTVLSPSAWPSAASVYCVEIKPKQGWSHRADRGSTRADDGGRCAFCAHQYLKLNRGDVPEISWYCPLDLFSGRRERMARAVHNLFRTPQNNLKVFRNGVPLDGGGDHDGWFGFGDGRRFCAFVAAALLGDFDDQHEVQPTASEAIWQADDEGTPRWPCDFDAVPTPRHCVLHRILAMQQIQTTSFADVCSEYDELMRRPAQLATSQFGHVGRLMTAAANWQTTALSLVDRYLVAATAKDCSVFVTFRRTTCMDVRVKVSDLDPKPLLTVHKHRKRNAEVLLACQLHLNLK